MAKVFFIYLYYKPWQKGSEGIFLYAIPDEKYARKFCAELNSHLESDWLVGYEAVNLLLD